MTTDCSLLLVHGRDFKPQADVLMDISTAALRAGIGRDFPGHLDAFDVLHKDVAWYGDLNAEVLQAAGKNYDEQLDVGDRHNALAALCELSTRKKFGIRHYDRLPGKSAIPEFVANIVAPTLGAVGLSMPLIKAVAKDMCLYFNCKDNYATAVRARLREKLCVLFDDGKRVALLTHGMGSVVAYDVLWQLSHEPEFKMKYSNSKIDLWLTLGAPLGDFNIKKRLLGAKQKAATRYPLNVISWHNVSAEDDYTCHDNTLADDYCSMMQQRVVSAVKDHRIYNLAVRYGRSNPHSSVGYYVHPRVSKILVDWLRQDETEAATSGTA
jgi:hypothetical protein